MKLATVVVIFLYIFLSLVGRAICSFQDAVNRRFKVDKKYSNFPPHALHPLHKNNTKVKALVDRYVAEIDVKSLSAHQISDQVCNRTASTPLLTHSPIPGVCSLNEYNLVLQYLWLQSLPKKKPIAIDDLVDITGSLPSKKYTKCERVDSTTFIENKDRFFKEYVQKSKPVIITGAVKDWKAQYLWKNKTYLNQKIGHKLLRTYIVPIKPGDVLGEYEVAKHLETQEIVMDRPAENEITFSDYLRLSDIAKKFDDKGRRKMSVYLQKHPLSLWGEVMEDIVPAITTMISPQLLLQNQLLWTSEQPVKAPLHHDAYENFHVVISGTKVFNLIHPTQNEEVYFSNEHSSIRSQYRFYEFEKDILGNDVMNVLSFFNFDFFFRRFYEILFDEKNLTPFSPVNIENPDLKKYPKFSNARIVNCEVHEGDILYIPAIWWHQVTSTPDPESGVVSGITHFHKPYITLLSDLKTFMKTESYKHLESIPKSRSRQQQEL